MKFTKFDLLVIVLVLSLVFVGINQERFFRVKGNNVFGTIMTHRTLVKRGYQSNVTVKGVDMQDHEMKELNGFIIDTEPDRIYFSSNGTTWLILPKGWDGNDYDDLKDSAFRPMELSSIYLEPTKQFKVVKECGEGSYVSGKFYYELSQPTDEIVCEFVTTQLIDRYGGHVNCKHAGNAMVLDTSYMTFSGDISGIISDIGNSVEKSIVLSKNCRKLVR